MKQSIADLRKDYTRQALNKEGVAKDPLDQFITWFDEALAAKIDEPNAMTLSTVSANGLPSGRIVLLKELNKTGFIFYSNYASAKGMDLANNPYAALTFFWPELERQVRIQGSVSMVDRDTSLKYFQSRPRASQIGAWTSPQSAPIGNRSILEERQKKLEEKYKGTEKLPLPNQWGGYIVEPFMIEFWQGRASRLHDRILYAKKEGKWTIQRLAP